MDRQLVFMSMRENHEDIDIALIDIDGSNLTFLTDNEVDDITPAWSPYGSRIAYASPSIAGDMDIMVMNADGSDQHALLIPERVDRYPTWSPDGEWIAFTTHVYSPDNAHPPLILRGRSVSQMDRVDGMTTDGQNLQILVQQGGFPAWQSEGGKYPRFCHECGH